MDFLEIWLSIGLFLINVSLFSSTIRKAICDEMDSYEPHQMLLAYVFCIVAWPFVLWVGAACIFTGEKKGSNDEHKSN